MRPTSVRIFGGFVDTHPVVGTALAAEVEEVLTHVGHLREEEERHEDRTLCGSRSDEHFEIRPCRREHTLCVEGLSYAAQADPLYEYAIRPQDQRYAVVTPHEHHSARSHLAEVLLVVARHLVAICGRRARHGSRYTFPPQGAHGMRAQAKQATAIPLTPLGACAGYRTDDEVGACDAARPDEFLWGCHCQGNRLLCDHLERLELSST